MRTARRTATLGVPLALVLAACGGTSDAADSDAAPSDEIATLIADGGDAVSADEAVAPAEELSPDEAALELSQCLRDEGLDVADIGVDADGNIDLRSALDSVTPGDEGVREAMDACREIIERAGFGGGRRGAQFDDPAVQDAFLGFSECIRGQGFEDVPDLATPAGRGERPDGAEGAGDGDGEGTGEGTGDGPPEGGRGQRNGDFGDRASRLAERLGLDPDDPDVIAAIETCQPILDDALGGVAPGAAPADAEA